ncbi:MAG: hypothetical protein RR359_03620 [Bacilli bacterium]
MDKNIIIEYEKAIKQIKLNSELGRYNSEFHISPYYENIDKIYEYIINKLKSEGFKVEIEKYGCGLSHTRLNINWKK